MSRFFDCVRTPTDASVSTRNAPRTRVFIGGHCRLRKGRYMRDKHGILINRILTTHAGRLDGPPELSDMLRLSRAAPLDPQKAAATVPPADRKSVVQGEGVGTG